MKPTLEPIYGALGKKIEAERKRQGIPQEALAAALAPPLTRAAISNIERAKQRVPIHVLAEIARVLGTSPSGLLAASSAEKNESLKPDYVQNELSKELTGKKVKSILTKINKINNKEALDERSLSKK